MVGGRGLLILFWLQVSFFQLFDNAHKDSPVWLQKDRLLAEDMKFEMAREGYQFPPANDEHGECSNYKAKAVEIYWLRKGEICPDSIYDEQCESGKESSAVSREI